MLKNVFLVLSLGLWLSSCTSPLIITKRNLILYQIEDNGKAGYINQKGRVCIDPIYDVCSLYDSDCNSSTSFYSFDGDEVLIIKKDGKFGLISSSGTPITPCYYDNIESDYLGCFKVTKDSKHGFIDSKGIEIVPIEFSSPYYFSNNNILPLKRNGKIGLYNVTTSKFKPLNYYSISPFQQGLATVETNNGDHGVIDTTGLLVVDTVYQDMQTFYSSNLLAVKNNGTWNYINSQGDNVIEGKYDDAELFWTDYAIVKKDGKFGVIDTLGNYILEPKYSHLYSTGGNILQISTGFSFASGRQGLINLQGDTILDCIYDDVFEYSNFAEVTIGQNVGVIDLKTGEHIIPILFSSIDYDDLDLTLLRFEDHTGSYMGYINRKNKIIWSNNNELLKKLLNKFPD